MTQKDASPLLAYTTIILLVALGCIDICMVHAGFCMAHDNAVIYVPSR